ncbi:hypothetical protein HDV64DRAFT_265278 [Trichoderma sp. TUCIM 5745]
MSTPKPFIPVPITALAVTLAVLGNTAVPVETTRLSRIRYGQFMLLVSGAVSSSMRRSGKWEKEQALFILNHPCKRESLSAGCARQFFCGPAICSSWIMALSINKLAEEITSDVAQIAKSCLI